MITGFWVGLASYRVGFGVIGSDSLGCAGARQADRWATALASWAAQEKASWAEAEIRPIRLGKIENLFLFSNFFINCKLI
jgi:hypothetical protein